MTTGKVLKMKFERLNIKHFAELATNNGVFGSAQASLKNEGTKTTDYNQIASLPAFKEGWNSATLTTKTLPPLEEMQGLESYLSYLINYLYQQGIAPWDANYTYYVGSVVVVIDPQTNQVKLYSSLTNDNTGNDPSTSADNWTGVGNGLDPNTFANTSLSNLDATGQGVLDAKLDRANFTNCVSKFPVNYLMRLSVDSYNQYKPNLNDGNEAIYPMGKNSSLAVGDTFVYGENTGTIKDITTDENGLSFAKITWSTTNYYGVAVTGASQFVLLKDGGQLVNMDNYSSAALIYSTKTPAQSDTYNIPAYWYDATNNVMKKSTDKGATWVDCYASFPLASFGTAKDTNGNISVTRCHFCNSVSFMGSKLILLPFGEITAVFYASSFANKRVEKVPTIFKTVEALGVLSNTTNGYYVGAYLTFKGSGSQRTFYVGEIHIFSNITNYGFSTGSSTYNLQTGGYYQYGEAGSNPLNFCPLGKFYTKYSTKDNYVSGVDCFGSLLNAPMQPIIQETYHNGTSWYRVWSDGFIEQGGIVTPAAISVDYTGNFIIAFNSVVLNMTLQDRAWYAQGMSNSIINPSGLTKFVYKIGNLGNVNQPMYWYACGY